MRIAALFLGLIAGLFALLAPSALRIDLMSPFLEYFTSDAAGRQVAATVWYAIAGAALLGGLLATITPGFASLLLIGAAVGWLGIAATVPQLMTYHLLVPAGAAGLGALLAMLAGELQIRRRRMARRNRKLAVEALETDDTARTAEDKDREIEREAALQEDPMLMPRQDLPITPRRAIPLTLDATAISRPANDPPHWPDLDAPHPTPLPAGPELAAEHRREPFTFAEELTTRRGMEPPPEPEFEATLEPSPEPPVQPTSNWRVERQTDAERLRYEPDDPRENERGRGWLAALSAVAAVLVIVGIAAGGYLLMRNGTLQALLGSPVAPSVIATDDAAAPAAEPAPATVAAKVELPAGPETIAPAAPSSAASSALTADTPAPVTATAAEPPAPQQVATNSAPDSFDNPFSYCRSLGTVDYVDHRYAGPAVVDAMTRVLLLPAGTPRDRVHWRCFEGNVLACTSYVGPICDTAPTVLEMREFCERNPNVSQLTAPSGLWSCADGKPQLPVGASWPVDERGFLPAGWVKVPDPGTPPAG